MDKKTKDDSICPNCDAVMQPAYFGNPNSPDKRVWLCVSEACCVTPVQKSLGIAHDVHDLLLHSQKQKELFWAGGDRYTFGSPPPGWIAPDWTKKRRGPQ